MAPSMTVGNSTSLQGSMDWNMSLLGTSIKSVMGRKKKLKQRQLTVKRNLYHTWLG